MKHFVISHSWAHCRPPRSGIYRWIGRCEKPGKSEEYQVVVIDLLHTGSEERGVLGVGSTQYFPPVTIKKLLHDNCTNMNIIG